MKRKILICTLCNLEIKKWYIITTSLTNMPKFFGGQNIFFRGNFCIQCYNFFQIGGVGHGPLCPNVGPSLVTCDHQKQELSLIFLNNQSVLSRGGARGGREGAIAPPNLTQTYTPLIYIYIYIYSYIFFVYVSVCFKLIFYNSTCNIVLWGCYFWLHL